MNNEETQIMQPSKNAHDNEETQIMQSVNNANKNEETQVVNSNREKSKESAKEKSSSGGVFAASVLGAAGGYAAYTYISDQQSTADADEQEVVEPVADKKTSDEPEDVQVKTVGNEYHSTHHASVASEPTSFAEDVADESDIVSVAVSDAEADVETYYAESEGNGTVGSDEVIATTSTSAVVEDDAPEVQVLGVYENVSEEGVNQEIVILSNGEELAAVIDVTGNGEADVIGIDHNQNMELEEGEIYDISDQHIGMSLYEEAYIAQQSEEEVMNQTDIYESADDQDYDLNLIDA